MQSDVAALKQRLISMKPVDLFGCLSESKYGTLKDFGWKMLRVPAPLSFLTKSDQVTDDSHRAASGSRLQVWAALSSAAPVVMW